MRFWLAKLALIGAVASGPLWAQARPVTYTEVSRRVDSIYLSYPDGSGKVLLHQAGNINGPALNRARPQVAYWNHTNRCIEVVTYTDGVSGAKVSSIDCVAPGGSAATFTPDGTKLVYTWSASNTERQIRWLSLADGSSGTLVDGVYANDFTWAGPDRLIYVTSTHEIIECIIDPVTMQVIASALVHKAANIEGVGAANTKNSLFFAESTASSIVIHEMDLGSQTVLGDNTLARSGIARGTQPVASPDDHFLLYKSERGQLSRISLTTGAVIVLTKSANYRQHDWRP